MILVMVLNVYTQQFWLTWEYGKVVFPLGLLLFLRGGGLLYVAVVFLDLTLEK